MSPFTPSKIVGVLLGMVMSVGLISLSITRTPPIGTLEATLVGSDDQPLPNEMVTLYRVEMPNQDAVAAPLGIERNIAVMTDEKGMFRLPNLLEGKYEINAMTKGHEYRGEVIISESKVLRERLKAKRRPDSMELYCNEHVVRPGKPAELMLSGLSLSRNVEIDIYSFPLARALSAKSIYDLYQGSGNLGGSAPKRAVLQRTQKETLASVDTEGVFTHNVSISNLKPGLYWVRARIPKTTLSNVTWFNVTNLGVIVKQSPNDLLLLACDLTTGEPEANVEFVREANGTAQVVGRSGANGIFRADPKLASNRVWAGRKDGAYALVGGFDVEADRQEANYTMFFQTDRPIYRPGDTVQIKGTLRRSNGRQHSLPPGGTVALTLKDSQDDVVEKTTAKVTPSGSFRYTFTTERWDEPGSYRLEATYGSSSEDCSIMLNEYRKPEYEITVEPTRAAFFHGETAQATVTCTYYFGGPVQNADVQVSIYRSPLWIGPESEYGYEEYDSYDSYEGYGGGGEEYFMQVEAKTDSSGRAIIEFPTKAADGEKSDSIWSESNVQYRIEAGVSVSGQYFTGDGRVSVLQGARTVSVRSKERIVTAGESFDVEVTALDALSETALPGSKVEMEAGYVRWGENGYVDKPFARTTLTTDASGKGLVSITPKRGGDVYVRAYIRDGEGRRASTTSSVWSVGAGAEDSFNPESDDQLVEIETDMNAYLPGETCRVHIQSSKPNAVAYFTLEGDRIRQVQMVRLKNGSHVIEMKVPETLGANIYATACVVSNGRFVERGRPIRVDLRSRKLEVTLTPEKKQYLPGSMATYTVRTTDEQGRPVPAEIGLGVVDESIYAIREDRTNIRNFFYPADYNRVRTSYSFESLYLDGGDKAEAKNIEIRRNFKDTAYWDPFVQTDANGRALVRFQLPDNLTTWRVTAIACSAQTDVGQSQSKFKVSKPLMARLTVPQYFVLGDEQQITLQVTNDSGRESQVHLDLSGSTNIQLEGEAKRTQRIAQGATESFTWKVRVLQAGSAVFVGRAWIDGGATDGVERTIPVHPMGDIVRKSETVGWTDGKTIPVERLPDADVATGSVTIVVTPNLYTALLGPLDTLIDYPYGCAEQTMSRFVPLAVLTKASAANVIPTPKRASEMPAMLRQGFARLRALHREDGSYGWWDFNDGDEGMTAFVLNGLADARDAGIAIPTDLTEKAVAYCVERVKKNPEARMKLGDNQNSESSLAVRDRQNLLLALARFGAKDWARLGLKSTDLVPSDVSSWATMARLYHALGMKNEAEETIAAIKGFAKNSGSSMGWGEDYGYEGTANALRAMSDVNPSDQDIQKVIRYLMLQRREGGWMSTRDTAAILVAMVNYLVATGSRMEGSPCSVTLNGEQIMAFGADAALDDSLSYQKKVPLSKLKVGGNTIQLIGSPAMGFATVSSFQVSPNPSVPELSTVRGLRVTRSYHLLDDTTLKNGEVVTLSNVVPISSAQSGRLVRVILTVEAEEPQSFFMLEDFLPSNCRTVEKENYSYDYTWEFFYDRMVLRDDRITFFNTRLESGSHRYSYVMRAEVPGTSVVPPVQASQMYNPDNFARSGSASFEVLPK